MKEYKTFKERLEEIIEEIEKPIREFSENLKSIFILKNNFEKYINENYTNYTKPIKIINGVRFYE